MYRGKRFLVLVLGLALLLGACGQPQEWQEALEITNTPTERPAVTVAPTARPAETTEPEGIVAPIEPSPKPEPENTPISTAIPGLEPANAGMDGVLVDNELCKIQAVSLEKGEFYYVLHLSVENRTDKELKFYVGDVYVNRVECCDWDCEVPAGTTIEDKLTLYGVEKYAGVTEISDITELCMPLEIYDENEAWLDIFERSQEGYWPEPIFQQTLYYYPQGEEQYVPFTYECQPDDIVVVDNEELTLLVIGDVYEETGGYEINLFLENHTDKRIWYGIDELALNGFLCEPFYEWEGDLYPETGAYGVIEYFDYWKDEIEGDIITEISFSLSAVSFDYDYHFRKDFTVYLQDETTVQEYVYIPRERDVVLYDGPEALFALTDIKLSDENGKMICTATAYVENKTEKRVYVQCGGAEGTVARAGEYLSDEWYDSVVGGKKRKVQLMLYDCLEAWDKNGNWVVTLTPELSIDAEDSYEMQKFFDETVTLLVSDEGIDIASDNYEQRED